MSQNKEIIVRIIGPVGVGKTAVYANIAQKLSRMGVNVQHAVEGDWMMMNNRGDVASAEADLKDFNPVVVLEEVVARTDTTMSDNSIMQYFAYLHLPSYLQSISRPFALLAQEMDQVLQQGPEKTAGLRKLLEAKDCAVRAFMTRPDANRG